MKYVFEYEETLMRTITIEADSLVQALTEIDKRIENADIVLDSGDFLGGKISMPLDRNKYTVDIEKDFESVTDRENYSIVLESW